MALKDIKYIIIHCSATEAEQDIDIADIDRQHRQRGWKKVRYHFFIKRDGTVQAGRGVTECGAHAWGYNSCSLGICLAGGRDAEGNPEHNFTARQERSLVELTHKLHKDYPEAEIIGHYEINPDKDCPCFDVRNWWESTLLPVSFH